MAYIVIYSISKPHSLFNLTRFDTFKDKDIQKTWSNHCHYRKKDGNAYKNRII